MDFNFRGVSHDGSILIFQTLYVFGLLLSRLGICTAFPSGGSTSQPYPTVASASFSARTPGSIAVSSSIRPATASSYHVPSNSPPSLTNSSSDPSVAIQSSSYTLSPSTIPVATTALISITNMLDPNTQQTFSLSQTDMLSAHSTVSISSTPVLLQPTTKRSSISHSSSFTITSTSDVSNISSSDVSSSISPSFTRNQTSNFQVSYLPTHSSNSPISAPVSNPSIFQSTGYSSSHLSTLSTGNTISSTQGYVPVFPPTRKISISQGNQSSPPSPVGQFYPCMVLGPGSCCTHALNQIPGDLSFEESEPAGLVLAEMKDIGNVSIKVVILNPTSLRLLQPAMFNITTSGSSHSLVVTKSVDLETLYETAGNDPEVNHIKLQIECSEFPRTSMQVPPRYVNVTIIDIDDTMPNFDHPDADSDCVVPVYSADTSEDYMGELALSPGTIRAVDGDMTSQNNISYTVIHSEPNDYHAYFDLDTDTGAVNKTRRMNASENGRYVLFVRASEDSPQQKSRVALVSIIVTAPSEPGSDGPTTVHPTVKLWLQIASAVVLMSFMCGIIVLIHHRYRLKHTKVRSDNREYDGVAMTRPKLALYRSPENSRSNSDCDGPSVTSPSHVTVAAGHVSRGAGHLHVPRPKDCDGQSYDSRASTNSNQSQKKRKLIIKKPLDTRLRPGWNAPPLKPKRTPYQPFKDWKQKGS